jgi:predicted nucleotidyltransferase
VNHGLSAKTVEALNAVLARHPQVEQAILFGSRAKGNYKPGSDIDLALKGSDLTLSVLNKLSSEIDDLPIPYEMSLVVLNGIDNPEMKAHIERVGIVFYERDAASTGATDSQRP